jgi:aryl-alcohol dehydrogenase-like predicted oxidoreductase
MAIERRPLGRTGTEVTILGYGAMELRGQPRGPAITDAAAGQVLNAVLDAGINLIDTSVDYGRSEELIGRYLGHRRDEYFLASKCGCPLDLPPGEGQQRWAAANLEGLLDGMSRMDFVLRFTLSHPGLSSTIVGTANSEHLRANLAVAERGTLPGDLYSEALRRLPATAAGR